MKTNIINYYIGAQVAHRRQDKKMTQSELAKKIDINRAVISSLESGRYSTRFSTLYEICRALECELSDLLPPKDFYFKNKSKKVIRRVVFQFEEEMSDEERND